MLPSTKLFLSVFKNAVFRVHYSIKIGDKPLGSLFFNPKVQYFMNKLITVNNDKIFRVRALGTKYTTQVYKFMTDEELEREKNKVIKKTHMVLQVPPIVDVSADEVEILANDSSLDGFDEHHSKIIFADSSLDLKSHERYIVVREPNGVLRTANRNERFRMNQIFFPEPYRELHTPKMFQPEHLNDILDRGEYEFILDRACIQFDADDEEFHNVLISTYERVDKDAAFQKLVETRHFGSLGFYLAINKKINNMLKFFIEKEMLMEASYLVNLYNTVHSVSPNDQGATAEEVKDIDFEDACKSVEDYLMKPSNCASGLKSEFDVLVLKIRAEKKNEEEIAKSHGL